MNRYILKRGNEIIEVLEGREDRRDKLMRSGYEWVNQPKPAAQKKVKAEDADIKRKVDPVEKPSDELPD